MNICSTHFVVEHGGPLLVVVSFLPSSTRLDGHSHWVVTVTHPHASAVRGGRASKQTRKEQITSYESKHYGNTNLCMCVCGVCMSVWSVGMSVCVSSVWSVGVEGA